MISTGCLLLDIRSYELSLQERETIAHPSVAGIILFSRNYHDKPQLRALTQSIYAINSKIIIAVDQEGGRVQRFKEGFTTLPCMRHWGEAWQKNPLKAKQQLAAMTTTMVVELQALGVNLSIAPVLDLDYGLNTVIADRSFSDDANVVIELATVVIDTMQANGMHTVAKHFPGHGGVSEDSHLELPVDDRSWDELWQADLRPFAQLAQRYDAIMPAHIVFPQVDSALVTYSAPWLTQILRHKLGFKGMVISDCLSMQAAAGIGSYADRAAAALAAGCDLLVSCNNQAGSIEVLQYLEQAAIQQSVPR